VSTLDAQVVDGFCVLDANGAEPPYTWATTPLPAPRQDANAPVASVTSPLATIIAARATTEGVTTAVYPGVRFIRISRPATFTKQSTFGLTLAVVAQGRKVARYGGVELAYDPLNYLVITGESMGEGQIIEASPTRPYLAVCVDIPADALARTLLAFGDEGGAVTTRPRAAPVPAFTAPLDGPITDVVIRLLDAIADPLERRMVAPLAMDELIFRLLRTEAAAVLRQEVAHTPEAGAIQQAMRFMRQNAVHTLTVKAVAQQVAMSPSHFAHRFRAIARMSPMRYLKQVRLQDARALMLSNGFRAAEVAARVGYGSPSHFTRDFKAFFGDPPAEHLRRVRAR
jgi:AraC-like DNA-binding protein